MELPIICRKFSRKFEDLFWLFRQNCYSTLFLGLEISQKLHLSIWEIDIFLVLSSFCTTTRRWAQNEEWQFANFQICKKIRLRIFASWSFARDKTKRQKYLEYRHPKSIGMKLRSERRKWDHISADNDTPIKKRSNQIKLFSLVQKVCLIFLSSVANSGG